MKLDELPEIGSTVKFYTYDKIREGETDTGIVIKTFQFDEQRTAIIIKPNNMEFKEITRALTELIN